MKFATIEMPVTVVMDGNRHTQTLCIDLTLGDEQTAHDAVLKLRDLLQDKLNTIDIGDCE